MYSVKDFLTELAIESRSPLYAVRLEDVSGGRYYTDDTVFYVSS